MIFSCIRHGRTEMNAQDLVCGVTDIPLIELGVHQAQDASIQIFDKIQKGEIPPIDLIISSPLLRAQQTAQIIAQKLNLIYQIETNNIETKNYKVGDIVELNEEFIEPYESIDKLKNNIYFK